MRIPHYHLSDSLRDQLIEALAPFMAALPGEDLMKSINYSDLCSPPMQLLSNDIAPVVGERIADVLTNSNEGKEILDRIVSAHAGVGDLAFVLDNMPKNGEDAYFLLGMQYLLNSNGLISQKSLSTIDGVIPQDLHHDGGVAFFLGLIFLHGSRVDETIDVPTAVAHPEEIIDVMVTLALGENTSEEKRQQCRDNFIHLLNEPVYWPSLSVRSDNKDMCIPRLETITDPLDNTHTLLKPAICSTFANQDHREMDPYFDAALEQTERYSSVCLQPNQLLVVNNELLLHARGKYPGYDSDTINTGIDRAINRLISTNNKIAHLFQMDEKNEPVLDTPIHTIATEEAALAHLRDMPHHAAR